MRTGERKFQLKLYYRLQGLHNLAGKGGVKRNVAPTALKNLPLSKNIMVKKFSREMAKNFRYIL